MAGVPDPKPRKRIVDPGAVKAKLIREPVCRLCGKPGRLTKIGDVTYVAGVSGHHLVPRGQGGDDVEDNIMPLCGDGTRGCHGDVEARRLFATMSVRATVHEEERMYILRKKGPHWFDRRYPKHPKQTPWGPTLDDLNAV